MSNPKEKAKELVEKYYELFSFELENTICIYEAKECALIAVDLRLNGDFIFNSIEYGIDSLEYWQEVKQELQNL
jgi:hypothetical protein